MALTYMDDYRVRNDLNRIASCWNDMLPRIQSPQLGFRPSTGTTVHASSAQTKDNDNGRHDDDVSSLDSIISARVEIKTALQGWVRLVLVSVTPVRGMYPSGGDVPEYVRFLTMNLDAMSRLHSWPDFTAAISRMSATIERIAEREGLIGTKIGRCHDCDRDVVVLPEDRAEGIGTCRGCGRRETTERWAEIMALPYVTKITISELIALAKREFGVNLTERGVNSLVHRGKLHPLGTTRPQKFDMAEVMCYLCERSAA